MNCPTCESPKPHLHPALQADGWEVYICRDPWHSLKTAVRESLDAHADLIPPARSVAKEAATRFRQMFKPVTYTADEGDSLEMRMLKKIHNITAHHLPNYSPLTPTEIRAIHSAAFAGIDGPEPDEPD